MKCDKLKVYEDIDDYIGYDDTPPMMYEKSEVDAAIAELKDENRRMIRALWLARAERAKWQSLYYWYAISDKFKSRQFDEVERKCRAKAEEYK